MAATPGLWDRFKSFVKNTLEFFDPTGVSTVRDVGIAGGEAVKRWTDRAGPAFQYKWRNKWLGEAEGEE